MIPQPTSRDTAPQAARQTRQASLRPSRAVMLMAGIALVLLVILPATAWYANSTRAAERAREDARALSKVISAFRGY